MKFKNIKTEIAFDGRFVNPPESAYRASGSMDCIYECIREDGEWYCIVTQYGQEEESPSNFDTLRECKDWAERQNTYLAGI